MTTAAFSYEPLSGTQIRLLRIKPGKGRLRCRIRTVYLSETPRYHALSYVWGDHSPARVAKVNNAPFPVTRSLYKALKAFRDMPPDGFLSAKCHLWVDAICINQNDENEKSRQIPRIKDIYGAADRVIVWLSSYSLWTSDKRQLIRKRIFCPEMSGGWSPRNLTKTVTSEKNEDVAEFRRILEHFLYHPWFYRIWTVQEAAFARKSPIFLYVFDKSIATVTLDQLDGLARWYGYGSGSCKLKELVRMRRWAQNPHNSAVSVNQEWDDAGSMIMRVLNYTRLRISSIPEDRVYGIYGLLQIVNTRFPELRLPAVDYQQPRGQVFADITKLIIQHTRNTRIITGASVGHRLPGQPTWVSDLSYCLFPSTRGPPSNPLEYPEISKDNQSLKIVADVSDHCETIVSPICQRFSTSDHKKVLERIEDIEQKIIRPVAARRLLATNHLWSALLSREEFSFLMQVRRAEIDPSKWLDLQRLKVIGVAVKLNNFFATKNGFLGRCEDNTPCETGDLLCVRPNEDPIILRKTTTAGTYEVIGPIFRYEKELNDPSERAFGRIQLV